MNRITFQKNPKKPSIRHQFEFVIANARLEGQHLTLSEKKDVLRVIKGSATADELVEKSIVAKSLKDRPRAPRKQQS